MNYDHDMEAYCKADIEATKTAYDQMYKHKTPKQKAISLIKKVIFNDPVTVVFWKDGTKTVVKADGDRFDPEKGLAMAIAKYFFNNQGYYYDVFKKWLPTEKNEFDELPKSLKETIDKYAIGIDLSPEVENVTNTHTSLYSVKELAERLNCSEDTIRRGIKNGKYPGARKEKGHWVILCKF